MMLRAVARTFFPVALAATICFSGTAFARTPAQAESPTQPATATSGETSDSGASTLDASTSLKSDSNDLASLYGTPVEQIIARVNDRVINNSDLARSKAQLAHESRQGNWSLDQYDTAQKNLLRDLIDQQLLLSKGKQLGITGDTELIKRLDEIRKQNHLESLDALEKAVEGEGTSYEDFKANIRNSIITQNVVRQEVASRIQISQVEVQKYYDEHRDSFDQEESVHLNEILIPTKEDATDSELAAAKAKADEVEAKLKAGGKFTELAEQYSGGPTAKQGGDLGDFKRGSLAKVLEDETFSLPVGNYTEPIRTRQGYIILQVTKHTPGGIPPLQTVESQIQQKLYVTKIEPALRQYLTRLRNEAYIDIRPGYIDSAASPNETKPTFTAYEPPQPKKAKKKRRFHKVYGRLADRPKTQTAPAATVPANASASAETPAANSQEKEVKEANGKQAEAQKNKHVKFRYGRTPEPRVSDRQVAGSHGPEEATPEASNADIAADPNIQPLGPDLEHTPTINPPEKHKTRFSDRARQEKEKKAKEGNGQQQQVKKQNSTKPTSLTPAELANRNVQSAPLGLAGNTADKKKKKKEAVKSGKKTRYSDANRNSDKDDNGKQSAPETNPTVPQP